jgi:hypothetical protein
MLGSTIAGIGKEVAMFEPPYRALRIFLGVFSLLAALGGLLMIFADRPLIMRILLRPPEGEVSTLVVSLLKEMGGMVLMLAVFLWLAARDPVKNVAIVDGFIAGLLRPSRDTARITVDDRRSQPVPCLSIVGTLRPATRNCRLALLDETTGETLGTGWKFLRF